jgi:hypothetical protein
MIRRRAKKLLDAALGATAVGLLRAVRCTNRRRAANLAGGVLRRLGPLPPEHHARCRAANGASLPATPVIGKIRDLVTLPQ